MRKYKFNNKCATSYLNTLNLSHGKINLPESNPNPIRFKLNFNQRNLFAKVLFDATSVQNKLCEVTQVIRL